MKIFRRISVGLAVVVALLAFREPDDLYFQIKKNFSIFAEVYKEVSTYYVDAVDPTDLMKTGISAMLSRLDPYTVVYDEGRNQQMEILSRGEYGGVGIEVDYRNGEIIIITPLEGTSAARKGVRAGDIVTSINGVDVARLAPNEIETLMAGEIGTTVTLELKRFGVEIPLSVELERERVIVNNVVYSGFVGEIADIAYISLAQFGDQAAQEVADALAELESQSSVQGLILDLRNNPGGLLNEAVELTDLFLPANKEVVRTKGRLEDNNALYTTSLNDQYEDLPVAVLINNGSASASEIVAGALQDWDRAVIVGEQSFGKGLVQIIRPLAYNHTLKITTSRYYIPSGRSIQSINYNFGKTENQQAEIDSSKHRFETKGGRFVFDGTGISPDIDISELSFSPFMVDLINKNHLLFFVNAYSLSFNPNALDTNKLFVDFSNYLIKAKYSYESHTEKELEAITELALNEGFSETDVEKIKQLVTEFKNPSNDLLTQHKSQIIRELTNELTGRFLGQSARKKVSLVDDPVVGEAVKILTSTAYSAILQPNG